MLFALFCSPSSPVGHVASADPDGTFSGRDVHHGQEPRKKPTRFSPPCRRQRGGHAKNHYSLNVHPTRPNQELHCSPSCFQMELNLRCLSISFQSCLHGFCNQFSFLCGYPVGSARDRQMDGGRHSRLATHGTPGLDMAFFAMIERPRIPRRHPSPNLRPCCCWTVPSFPCLSPSL